MTPCSVHESLAVVLNSLPLIERELRVRGRLPSTRWLRVGLATAGLLLASPFLMIAAGPRPLTSLGERAFHALGWLGFLLALSAGLLAADTISGERRAGTLGLLFLTPLRGIDVVLSKLASAGLNALYALIGFAPVLALTVLAGGVTGGEIARVTLVLGETLLWSLAVGLCFSTFAETPLQAVGWSAFAGGGCLLLPWVAAAAGSSIASGVVCLSPLKTFLLAGDLAYRTKPNLFWFSAVMPPIELVGLLGFAGWRLGRTWGEQESPSATSIGAPRKLRRRRARIGESNPIDWLVRRRGGASRLRWYATIFYAASTLGFVFFLSWRSGWMARVGGSWVAGLSAFSEVLRVGAMGLFAWLAGRFLLELRKHEVIELLITTPLGPQELIRAGRKTVFRSLRAPIILAVLAAPAFMLLAINRRGGASFDYPWFLIRELMAAASGFLSLLAIVWLAWWLALRCRNALWLIGWTVGIAWFGQSLVDVTGTLLIRALAPKLVWTPNGSSPAAQEVWLQTLYLIPTLLKMGFACCVIAWCRRAIVRDSATLGAPPGRLSDLARDVTQTAARKFSAAWHYARHWTPPGRF